jgi:hypothetical protein
MNLGGTEPEGVAADTVETGPKAREAGVLVADGGALMIVIL